MQGVIDIITAKNNRSRLTDENGANRNFDHGQLTSKNIKVHDAVEFTLSGIKVTDIELLQKHANGVVFYWV